MKQDFKYNHAIESGNIVHKPTGFCEHLQILKICLPFMQDTAAAVSAVLNTGQQLDN